MVTVNVAINGQKLSVPAGSTVLRAAQSAGIDIPTLCDHPALAPIGACRVCLVEVKGQRVLQPACTFPVSEGMEVQTETPAVVQARKFVLDLLFSERNHYCMYCEMSGDCELQDLGYRYGLDHWVYPTYTRGFPVDATRQYFLMDHNRCILCRRCVRACAELVANHTLGERERGAKTMIHADMNVPFGESSCVSCGTCLQVCPTGSLVDKRSAFMGRNVQTQRIPSTCSQCSAGCGMEIIVRGGGVLRLEGDWGSLPNGGLLCQKGRFDPLYDQRPRVKRPLVRQDGVLREASWEAALELAAQRLRQTEADRVGVLASSNATNEALYLLSAVFGAQLQVSQTALLNNVVPDLLRPKGTLEELADGCDAILVVGADPVAEQPVVSFLIKRMADKGIPLIVVDGRDNGLAPFASVLLAYSGIAQAVEMAARAERPIVIYSTRVPQGVAELLQKLEKAVFVPLQPGVNTQAAVAFGLNQGFDPAGVETFYVLLGEEGWTDQGSAASIRADAFTIVQASYVSPLTERADVVLPMAIWSERSGSLTNSEGRIRPVRQAVEPQGEAKADWQILAQLAARLKSGAESRHPGLLAEHTTLEELTALATQELNR